MLARKLDSRTLAAVRARADYFFSEQLARLGPLPGALSPQPVPVPAAKKRGRPRKQPVG